MYVCIYAYMHTYPAFIVPSSVMIKQHSGVLEDCIDKKFYLDQRESKELEESRCNGDLNKTCMQFVKGCGTVHYANDTDRLQNMILMELSDGFT